MQPHLVILGLGYSAGAAARCALDAGWRVTGTQREAQGEAIAFDDAATALRDATHVLCSIPPVDGVDPALARYGADLRAAARLQWVGYYSTTGVYGDHQGGVVSETTPPRPAQPRSAARVRAEDAWRTLAAERGAACDVMRLGGIYGPGRSALETVASGRARAIDAPDHLFSRIHRDDIAQATLAAARTASGTRVLNFADDMPSTQRSVLEEAARLLGVAPPPVVTLAEAWPDMSDMARSFWSERRVVNSAATQSMLGRPWRYPDYREGLAAILRDGGRPCS